MDLKNKTIVITGGSEGLGYSLAHLLVSRKAKVHILSRNQIHLNSAKAKIKSSNLFIHQGDVANYRQLADIYEQIGDIDILINNAGVWLEGNIVDNEENLISSTIDVNLKGVIYSTKAALPCMVKKNEGIIFNISSTSGLIARELQSVYVASKFGVRGFTESLELDLIKTKIKVYGFYPGGMNTGLFTKAGNPRETSDWMDTKKVAEVIVFMLEHDETMIIKQAILSRQK